MIDPVQKDIDAILAIPLYSQHVDLVAIRKTYPGCPIVLDLSHLSCSQSQDHTLHDHEILVSSLQASKVLTCGEGGFVGTNDRVLSKRLEGLRTDGRVFEDDPTAGNTTLSPHGRLHGANYAMSEISAGLLLDQIERLDRQMHRRSHGGRFLLDCFDRLGVEYYADPDCVADGLHYGIPVRVQPDPSKAIDRVRDEVGLCLDRCYPPLPQGPLCIPLQERRYRDIVMDTVDMRHARRWHDNIAIVPHQALLESDEALLSLAHCLAGVKRNRPTHRIEFPKVTVIIVTDGRRHTLARALDSVASQSYRGQVAPLLIFDRCDPAILDWGTRDLAMNSVRVDLNMHMSTIDRVSMLRDLALRLCRTELVCFLDDDNRWEVHHLDSLYSTMVQAEVPAAHCWRRIVRPDGSAWDGDSFPWLEKGSLRERQQFEICKQLGIIVPGSNIVRDNAYANSLAGDGSMIDLGAWLLRSEILRVFGISAKPDGSDVPIEGIGEDDVLLKQLKSASIPIACTAEATLEYSLGGFSNDPERRVAGWSTPRAAEHL